MNQRIRIIQTGRDSRGHLTICSEQGQIQIRLLPALSGCVLLVSRDGDYTKPWALCLTTFTVIVFS